MRVILQKPVENLGAPGDVVEVADGYARNYLVPRGLAVKATKGAMRHAESLRRAHEARMAKARAEAEAAAQRITAAALRIPARVGEEGKLFGSITAEQIAEEIERQTGVAVDRHDVRLEQPIRSVGVHEVRVHLFAGVDPVVQVEVVPAE
ncbi:MAG TPA: 50S ribosomal protein L9 [Actinomycetota bacterium]|jgi:large subunit ribosomal protein L9|nr:50S ribosomal protein L9 [Actinomycetota bacterium]